MSIEILCQGWLEKKKKQRYFVLAGLHLFWFLQFPSFGGRNVPNRNTFSSTDAAPTRRGVFIEPKEDCKEAKGVLNLSRSSICLDPERTHCILVTIFSQCIAIEAKSEADVDRWYCALSECLKNVAKWKPRSLLVDQLMKSGNLIVNDQEAYVELNAGKISVYLHGNEALFFPDDSFSLKSCELQVAPDKSSFTLVMDTRGHVRRTSLAREGDLSPRDSPGLSRTVSAGVGGKSLTVNLTGSNPNVLKNSNPNVVGLVPTPESTSISAILSTNAHMHAHTSSNSPHHSTSTHSNSSNHKIPSSNERLLHPTRASVYLGSNPKSGFSSAIALSRQTREAEQEREREREREIGAKDGKVALGTFQFASPHGPADTKLWMLAVKQHLDTIKHEEDDKLDDSKDIEFAGPLILLRNNKRKYFKLTNSVLVWYNEDTKGNPQLQIIEGSLTLVGAHVVLPKEKGCDFALMIDSGPTIFFKAATINEANNWIKVMGKVCDKLDKIYPLPTDMIIKPIEVSGWLEQRRLGSKTTAKRYAFLGKDATHLRLFENASTEGSSKSDIFLGCCHVSSLNANTFLLCLSGATIDDIPFGTNSQDETWKWIENLERSILYANQRLSRVLLKYEWMIAGKAQQLRWVVVTRNRKVLWFMEPVRPDLLKEANARGFVDLVGSLIIINPQKRNSFIVTDKKGQSSTFTCRNANSFEIWYEELTFLSTESSYIKPRSLTFDVSIEELCKIENSQIPEIVVTCIEFILKYGIQQGIFRLAGSQSELNEIVERLDDGERCNFSPQTDVNLVASILKLFLRKLKPSLVPYDLYHSFVTEKDPSQLARLAKQLKPSHYRVASYLFNFLQKISRYHEVTQMDAQNLAIVFAPNILVSNDTDDIRRLREAPLIGKATKILIENANVVFPERRDKFGNLI